MKTTTITNGILQTVGHTPLVALQQCYQQLPLHLYAKLEMFNPGGSLKDRPALLMLLKALEEGKLKDEATVIESSSGNMAIGLAQACRYLDLNLVVVVDPKINRHTLRILQAYGAQIERVNEADASGNYLANRLKRVRELLDHFPHSFWPNQYANEYNPAAHYQTMGEIIQALPEIPDYLLVATSTCGTIMGCARYIQEHKLGTKIVAVDAAGSVIFGAPPADRLVPGHGAGRPSDLLEEELVDHVIYTTDKECVAGCRDLLHHEAILAGGSSGAVISAIKKLQPQIPGGSTCALVLPDSGERYLDTIYDDQWVQKHLEYPDPVSPETYAALPFISQVPDSAPAPRLEATDTVNQPNIRKIAIIGGGPKGMYGFERLAAQFKACSPKQKIQIHIYNQSPYFGAGAIYSPNQPSYLIINNPVGDIQMWSDERLPPVVENPLPATKWLQTKDNPDITSRDYVSRATVGHYLQKGFQGIATHLPPQVSGSYLVGEVTDIYKDNDQYGLTVATTAGYKEKPSYRYDHILLATGHPKNKPDKQDQRYQTFAESRKALTFVPFIYPVNLAFSPIRPGQAVAVKGIGLTFVDAILALTEGRGGDFIRMANQKLTYQRSGSEPSSIYPFSRSGLPMIPRTPPPDEETTLKFFTAEAISALREEQECNKLDFKQHLWPLLHQEFLFAFYDRRLKKAGSKNDLSSCTTFKDVVHDINHFHHVNPEVERFDPGTFLNPVSGGTSVDAAGFHEYVQSYLRFFIAEAKKGEQESPWAAVTAVWRKATPVFGKCYKHGGLTPKSQRFFDRRFRRLLNRVTFGPPVESVEKLVALMDSGLLQFNMARNPIVKTDSKRNQFLLESTKMEQTQPVEALVDARISKVALPKGETSLYRNLLDRGLIKLFNNEDRSYFYKPGCIAVTSRGFVIDSDHRINTAIAATGTPTEGITFDNDSLRRKRNNVVSDWAAFIGKKYAKGTSKQITNDHAS